MKCPYVGCINPCSFWVLDFSHPGPYRQASVRSKESNRSPLKAPPTECGKAGKLTKVLQNT